MDLHFNSKLSAPSVTVYWIPNNEASMRLREFMVGKGIGFTSHDITTSAADAVEMMKLCGQNTAPLIIAGDRQWMGWSKEIQSSLQSALKV